MPTLSSGHCKDLRHLSITVVPTVAPDYGPGKVTASHIAKLTCVNVPTYSNSGVLVNSPQHQAALGLHVEHDAALALPDMFRSAAASCGAGKCVLFAHTVKGNFIQWCTLTPAGALDLADAIVAAT